MPYQYHKVFDPPLTQSLSRDPTDTAAKFGDQPERLIYIYTEKIILAVNIAMVTGRPLLVRGAPGSGKTALAPNVARFKNWRYYKEVISSRTQASDLQWQFDALRRLNDAQARQLRPNAAYVTPGVLWRALDPAGAEQWEAHWEASNQWPMLEPVRDAEPIPVPAVVLLDEIDKAEPDVPNNLLEVLGAFQFTVQESGTKVEARTTRPPLIVITSNDERDLPRAFLRRCVLLNLEPPTAEQLVAIAKLHFDTGPVDPAHLQITSASPT